MIIVGLLVLGIAIAAGVDVAAQNRGQSVSVQAIGHHMTASPAGLVAFGAVCAFVAVLGIMVLHDGSVRARRRRLEVGAARANLHQAVGGEASSDVTDLRDSPARVG